MVYPFTVHQRCWFHKMQNVAAKVRKRDRDAVVRGARRIYQAPTRRAAISAFWRWAKRWRGTYPKAVGCVETDLEALLAHFKEPPSLRATLRTTNPIERVFREVRRRTKPMTVVNNDDSLERVAYSVFHHLNTQWERKPKKVSTQNSRHYPIDGILAERLKTRGPSIRCSRNKPLEGLFMKRVAKWLRLNVWVGILLCLSFVLVPASGFSAEKVKFGFSWILVAQTIPFYVALDKGYWRTEGLDVNILRGFGSGDAVKKVAAGATDIGAADSATLVIARSKGAMVKEVAMTHMKTMHTICTLKSSGIGKPRDLIGKKIASTAKASTRVIFPAFTEMNGFKESDITWLTASYAAVIPSVMTGNADAAVCYAAEMPQIRLMARKADKVMVPMRFADHGLNMYGNGVIASDKAISGNPKFVRAFVRGAVKGWGWSVENRQAATDIYLKYHGEANAKIAREIMDVLGEHFVTNEARKHGYGFMTKETMTRTRDLMARFYGIKNVMPVEDLYTNRFIPKIMPK